MPGTTNTTGYTGACNARGSCKANTPNQKNWHDRVHYAVYHAPGWEAWQKFRKDLVGKTPPEKLARLKKWPLRSEADAIRIVNYTRSLRGSWSTYPSIATFSQFVNKRLQGEDVPREVGPGENETEA